MNTGEGAQTHQDPQHHQWGSQVPGLSRAAMGRGGVKPGVDQTSRGGACTIAARRMQGAHGCRRGSGKGTGRGTPCSPPHTSRQGLSPGVTPYLSLCPWQPGVCRRCRPGSGRRSPARGGNQAPSSCSTATPLFPAAGLPDGARPAPSKETFHSESIPCCLRQAPGRLSPYGSIAACAAPASVWAGSSDSEERGAADALR